MSALRAGAHPLRPERPARLLGIGALVVILSAIPYLCGYLLAPPGKSFLGALNNVGDLSQYLAAIRQGSRGAWLYANQFTPDHARRLLIYTPYLLAGHLSLGLSSAAAFNVLRLVSAGVLLYALARFCRLFIGPFALRPCWLFVLFAGGLYWLALPLSAFVPALVNPAALTAPELNPLITLLISPHESLGLAAELMGFVCILRAAGAGEPLWAEARSRPAEPAEKTRMVAGAAAWFLLLALSYPFLLPTVALVLLAYAGVAAHSAWNGRIAAAMLRRRLQASEVLSAELRVIAIALIPAGVVGLYYLDVFRWDPLWSHSGLAQVGRPDIGVLLFAFGALVLGAYAGSRRLLALRRSGANAVPAAWAWFPLIWSVVNICTLMLPIWQQGRQALGLSVPLALLSFLSLAGPQVIPNGLRNGLPPLPASALAFSAPLLVALYTAITAGGVNENYYVPSAVARSVDWIGANAGDDDVVVASAGYGNLLPETCSCRVVVGQNFQTFNWTMRQQEVHHFYHALLPADAIAALQLMVRREGVTYVVYSPLERNIGRQELQRIPGFRLAYSGSDVRVFTSVRAPH